MPPICIPGFLCTGAAAAAAAVNPQTLNPEPHLASAAGARSSRSASAAESRSSVSGSSSPSTTASKLESEIRSSP
jgi:hypothetical protein